MAVSVCINVSGVEDPSVLKCTVTNENAEGISTIRRPGVNQLTDGTLFGAGVPKRNIANSMAFPWDPGAEGDPFSS